LTAGLTPVIELGERPVPPLHKILDGVLPRCFTAVDGKSAVAPPQTGTPVLELVVEGRAVDPYKRKA
jgi:hypothetical protein